MKLYYKCEAQIKVKVLAPPKPTKIDENDVSVVPTKIAKQRTEKELLEVSFQIFYAYIFKTTS